MDNAAVLNVAIWVVATVSTAAATWFVSRRSGKSNFLTEVLKENEWLRAKNREFEADMEALDTQCRSLGQENMRLLRRIEKESR